MSVPLRVLVVDDEPPARRRLTDLLKDEPGFELAGVCEDGVAAVERILCGGIDLVLLDVQMPGLDGFEVVQAVGSERMPPIVFVTAFDEHAIRAFEVHALDYLLKPFDRARMRRALGHARREIEANELGALQARLSAVLGDRQSSAAGERLVLRTRGGVLVLRPEEIERFEAAGNYLRAFVGGAEHLTRATMKSMEERLSSSGFLRVHRSILVNGDCIRELRPRAGGECLLVLRDGTTLQTGRRYRRSLAAFLQRSDARAAARGDPIPPPEDPA